MPTKIEFTSADRKKIHNLYAKGNSVNSIAKLMGVSHTPVNKFLKSEGVNTTDFGRGKKGLVFTAKERSDIARRYARGLGESPTEIGTRYDCCYLTIVKVLKELGVHNPDSNVKRRIVFTEDQEDSILREYVMGMSANAISNKIGCNDGKILAFLRSRGINTTDFGRGKTKQSVPWTGFTSTCRSLTSRIYRDHKEHINPNFELMRYPDYHLDHILSIAHGIEANLTVLDLAHPCNLQMLPAAENLAKYSKSDISVQGLLNKIKTWNKEWGDPFESIAMEIEYTYKYGRYRYFSGTYTHFKVYK